LFGDLISAATFASFFQSNLALMFFFAAICLTALVTRDALYN
jgi:hypothetical protein